MSLSYLLLTAAIIACDQPPHAGEEGYPCRTGWTTAFCNDGLRCDSQNVCVACGGLGEMCCSQPGGSRYCNEGACDGVGFEGYGACSNDCGAIGLACCAGTCPTSGNCVGGTCQAVATDACLNGSETHVVRVIPNLCNAKLEVVFKTDTLEQAEACRLELVAAAKPGEEVCPLDATPTDTTACAVSKYPPSQTHYFLHCSAEQLASCEQNSCDNCIGWTEGACPP